VSLNYVGGHRTTLTMMITGLDIEAKAAAFQRALWTSLPGGRKSFDEVDIQLLRTDQADPPTNEAAVAQLRITVKDRDERKVGRAFGSKVTELALASYPGLFAGPGSSQAYGVYWPATIPSELVWQEVVVGGTTTTVESTLPPADLPTTTPASRPTRTEPPPDGPTGPLALGRLVGARSGDKGGNANLGVFARSDAAYRWIAGFLTMDRLRDLMPETAGLEVERHELANLRSLNFVLHGLLGEGVASSPRMDSQAKGLGEYLRAKVVEIPLSLHPGGPR
jgi:hypothetical protein